LTSASVETGRSDNRPDFKFIFPPQPQPAREKTLYLLPEPFQLETNGAIININTAQIPVNIKGDWSKVWEIVDFHEFKVRFPGYRSGTHFCYLTGVGTKHEGCDDRNCSGICNMNDYPKFCSCD